MGEEHPAAPAPTAPAPAPVTCTGPVLSSALYNQTSYSYRIIKRPGPGNHRSAPLRCRYPPSPEEFYASTTTAAVAVAAASVVLHDPIAIGLVILTAAHRHGLGRPQGRNGLYDSNPREDILDCHLIAASPCTAPHRTRPGRPPCPVPSAALLCPAVPAGPSPAQQNGLVAEPSCAPSKQRPAQSRSLRLPATTLSDHYHYYNHPPTPNPGNWHNTGLAANANWYHPDLSLTVSPDDDISPSSLSHRQTLPFFAITDSISSFSLPSRDLPHVLSNCVGPIQAHPPGVPIPAERHPLR
ncbi:hypothetical protein CPLU01_13106 [Colletotrichum plurivorum]|uniref:Uncharacterized protein n=1 Tax=Colletotrichum plurivorum TaxID=2175906 RepID=A0A8H6JUU5_9PEZI|nr:hypothetical protein CPLU01_13106 [Colletotrichum plurivorum]